MVLVMTKLTILIGVKMKIGIDSVEVKRIKKILKTRKKL